VLEPTDVPGRTKTNLLSVPWVVSSAG
jgi:hypothetical protein